MDEHSINPKTARHMNILRHSVAKSRHSFTSRAGLMVPATLLGRLGLGETVDELMPAPGSSRGYRHGMIFETFMLTSCRRSTAGCWSDAQIVWRHSQRADAS
ncbi:MAG: hypothetical protein OXD44_08695, partial [Gammaproteobacteria bacterium]|nr:hypothetical protein [Gammaproteobacteria bacterium]